MTFQRSWRAWVSRPLIAAWLRDQRYGRLNAEYRIAEDARLATDPPIDFAVADWRCHPGRGGLFCRPGRVQLADRQLPRLAECLSSANRVVSLLQAFDRLEAVESR